MDVDTYYVSGSRGMSGGVGTTTSFLDFASEAELPQMYSSIKRFVVNAKGGSGLDEVTLVLSRVSSQDRQAIADKIQALSGVNQVSIVTRADDQAILDAL